MRFRDKVVVVTGSASGIGRAACTLFDREGARTVGFDLAHDETGLLPVAGHGVRVDVTDEEQVRHAIDFVRLKHGRIDILVNCAAVMTFAPVRDLTLQEWNDVLATNLTGPFLLAKYCLPHMQAGGAIVNVSSVHASRTTTNVAGYAASKGGLEAFTRALSIETASAGIRVNSVAPGGVDTPMLWSNPEVQSEKFDIEPASPDQIAAVVAFLASEDASFVSGSLVVADGGQLAKL